MVNVEKTKVLCSREDVSKSKIASVKFPYGECMKKRWSKFNPLSCQN